MSNTVGPVVDGGRHPPHQVGKGETGKSSLGKTSPEPELPGGRGQIKGLYDITSPDPTENSPRVSEPVTRWLYRERPLIGLLHHRRLTSGRHGRQGLRGGVPALLQTRLVRARVPRVRHHAGLDAGTLARSLRRVGRHRTRLGHALLPRLDTRMTYLLPGLRAWAVGTRMSLGLPPPRPAWSRAIGLIKAGPSLRARESPRLVELIREWRIRRHRLRLSLRLSDHARRTRSRLSEAPIGTPGLVCRTSAATISENLRPRGWLRCRRRRWTDHRLRRINGIVGVVGLVTGRKLIVLFLAVTGFIRHGGPLSS